MRSMGAVESLLATSTRETGRSELAGAWNYTEYIRTVTPGSSCVTMLRRSGSWNLRHSTMAHQCLILLASAQSSITAARASIAPHGTTRIYTCACV
jgi:hypothetical protein